MVTIAIQRPDRNARCGARYLLRGAALFLLGACSINSGASLLVRPSFAADVPGAAPVKIEREKPEQTKRPSLVFLRENLEFLRTQMDGVYWNPEVAAKDGKGIDPRWLDYLEMGQAFDEGDAALEAEDAALNRGRLLASVGELVGVEERLGELSSLLEEHEARLARLHADYVDDHVTSLVLLARGYPDWNLDGLRLRWEDGRESVLTLDDSLEQILRSGGVVEIEHEFIEPRAQWLELAIPASTDHPALSVYFQVEPERDRLHFVQLNLESFDLGRPTSEWQAETWSRPTVLGSIDWTW